MSAEAAAEALSEPPPSSGGAGFWDVVTGAQGVANNIIDSTEAVFLGGQDMVGGVVLGAQDTIGELGAEAGETARDVASPLNLLGFGFGSTVGAVVLGTAAAAVADQVFLGGAGRTALFATIRGRRR